MVLSNSTQTKHWIRIQKNSANDAALLDCKTAETETMLFDISWSLFLFDIACFCVVELYMNDDE